MKKSKTINLRSMRKQARAFALAPLALAIMAGCSPEPKESVKFVTDIDDCTDNTDLSVEQCEAVYSRAVKDAENTSPRYQHINDCQREFGSCERNDNGVFVPLMAGFIVSELIDEAGDVMEAKYRRGHVNPVYNYKGRGQYNNQIMTADGNFIGKSNSKSFSVDKSALQAKPKPQVTKTISRGGFGSKAAAKSSWGSSSKSSSSRGSSRGGWGG